MSLLVGKDFPNTILNDFGSANKMHQNCLRMWLMPLSLSQMESW